MTQLNTESKTKRTIRRGPPAAPSEPPAKKAKAKAKAKASSSSGSQAKRSDVGEEACPEAGGRVHFSVGVMHQTFKPGQTSIPYQEDDYSEYVGVGRYPDNKK